MKRIIEVAAEYWLDLFQQYTGIDWTQGNAFAVCKLIMAVLLGIAAWKILAVMIKVWKKVIQYQTVCHEIADYCAKANEPRLAAWYYKRSGDRKLMANELAKAGFLAKQAGQVAKGIKLMEKAVFLFMQERDYGAVGRIYEARGNFSLAVAAHLKAGDIPSAAAACGRGGESEAAVRMFCDYFEKTQDPGQVQLKAAKKCWKMLEPRGGYGAIPRKFRSRLLPILAMRFDRGGEYWHAGTAYYLLADYEDCTEALKFYLAGKTADNANLELFYLLGDTEDNLGNLKECLDTFRLILAVDPNYREGEVANRVSDIASREAIFGSGSISANEGGKISMMDTAVRQGVEAQFAGQKRFNPIKRLGSGGMGMVWLVNDTKLGRKAVFKRVRPDLKEKADTKELEKMRQRLIKEAQAAASIEHHGLVAVYDIGEDEDGIYIVMQYVDGPDLHSYIRHEHEGRLSLQATVSIMKQVCDALGAVHKARIIHRDMKPANILIGPGGKVKLTDFGLATAEGKAVGKGGTFQFMSPEQARGEKLDARTDIYAVGLIIHEALTGKVVFEDAIDAAKRLVQEQPKPPSETVAGIPPELDAVVMKCLAENCEDRYQTISEVLRDLRRIPLPSEHLEFAAL